MKINHSEHCARDDSKMKQDIVTLREITKETLWDILQLKPSNVTPQPKAIEIMKGRNDMISKCATSIY